MIRLISVFTFMLLTLCVPANGYAHAYYDHPKSQACFDNNDNNHAIMVCLLEEQTAFEKKVYDIVRKNQSYAEDLDANTNHKFNVTNALNNAFDQFQKYLDAECTGYVQAMFTNGNGLAHGDAKCRIALMDEWIKNHTQNNNNLSAPQTQGEK